MVSWEQRMMGENLSQVNKDILPPSRLWNWTGVKCQIHMCRDSRRVLQCCADQFSFEIVRQHRSNWACLAFNRQSQLFLQQRTSLLFSSH